MIDPITLTIGASKFISVIVTTTQTAYKNINRCREISDTLAALIEDGMQISKVLTVFDDVSAEAGLLDGPNRESWASVKTSLFHLAQTMKALVDLLRDIQNVDAGILSNPIKVFKHDARAGDIENLRKRIAGLSISIQLSVQFITL
jgi:hypothetical protein